MTTGTGQVGRSGFTLLEMVTATVIMSLVFAALSSVALFVSHAMPEKKGAANYEAEILLDTMSSELANAIRIVAQDASNFRMYVPDRDGDAVPELIEYSWSGTKGDPVVRSVNGGTGVQWMRAADSFAVDLYSERENILGLAWAYRVYDTQATISVTPTSSSELRRSTTLMNRPPELDAWVWTEFDENPELINRDRIGGVDWNTPSGSIDDSDLDDGRWKCDATLGLRSDWEFEVPTTARVRFEISDVGKFASFDTWGDVNGGGGVYIQVKATLTSKDPYVYSIVMREQTTLLTWSTLWTGSVTSPTGLDMELCILPLKNRYALSVNDTIQAQGTYSRGLWLSSSSGGLSATANNNNVLYDRVEVRVGGTEY